MNHVYQTFPHRSQYLISPEFVAKTGARHMNLYSGQFVALILVVEMGLLSIEKYVVHVRRMYGCWYIVELITSFNVDVMELFSSLIVDSCVSSGRP